MPKPKPGGWGRYFPKGPVTGRQTGCVMIRAALRCLIQQLTKHIYIRGLPRLLWSSRGMLQPPMAGDLSRVATLPNGLRFALLVDDYFQWMSVWGYFQPEIECLILDSLGDGDIFVDIGANVGLFSLAARQRVGGNGRVIAIEPEPRARRILQHNITVNDFAGEFHLLENAISDHNGTLSFSVAKQLGHSTAVRDYSGIESLEQIAVQALTLDEALVRSDVDPGSIALVKVDVEGLECEVLGGARRVLESRAALIVEVNPHALAANGKAFEDLWEIIAQAGRTAMWVQSGGGNLRFTRSYQLRPISDPRSVEGQTGDIFIPARSA